MAFDYSSVKNKKRKDEKTSGFNYSSVVGKTERTEEEKREYVKQQSAQKRQSTNGRQQVTYAGKYNSAAGKAGYNNYLKSKEPKSDKVNFGNLFALAGYTAGSNTSAPNLAETAYGLRTDTSYKEPGDDWLDEEKNIFGYLWENDRTAAEKYATEVNNAINKYKKDLESKKVADYSTENFGQGILASASSIASNALSGADYLSDLVEYNARGVVTEKEDFLTPYEYTQAVRGSIASDLNEYGTIAGKGLGDLFQIGMSAADSFALGHLGIADPAFFGIGATAAMNEARERGVSENQAFAYGLTSGVMEAVFEHIGIDNMLKMKSPHTLSQAVKGVLKQSGVEALEEMGTELTNTAWDAIINMDKSEFVASYANYISEGKGRGEALARAFADLGGEVLWAGISGALSGTMTGTVQTGVAKTGEIFGDAVNKADARKAVKDLGKDRDAVLDYAMETEEGSEVREAAEDIKARTERGEKVSNKEYADVLLKTDNNFAKAEIKRQLETEATSIGEELSDEQLDSMSTAVLKTMRGEFISETENAQIEQSKTAKNVYARNMGVDYTYGEQLSKEKKAELKETRTQQVLFEAVKDHSEGYKQTLTKAYEDYAQSNESFEMDAEDFANEFSSFYDIGRAGVESVDRALEAYGKGNPQLTNALARAYELGKGENRAENIAQAEIKQQAAKKGVKGKIVFEGNVKNRIRNKQQAEAINFMANVLKDTTNMEYHIFASYEKNGERYYKDSNGDEIKAPNGFYDPDAHQIWIDVNAGSRGQGIMLYTLTHEHVHDIRVWSPEHYNNLLDIAVQTFEAEGMDFEKAAQDKYKSYIKNHPNYTMDAAREEVVADMMSGLLSNEKGLAEFSKQIQQKDASLWNRIKAWFKDVIARITKAYEDTLPESYEARMLMENKELFEKAQKVFAEAVVAAGENYRNAGVEIDTATESVAPSVMFSERTWSESEYVKARNETARAIASELDVSLDKAYDYIDSINSVAKAIADDRARLDYDPNLDEHATVLKPNSEYGVTVDMSTLCAKRLLTTGTFDAIQKKLPNMVFDSEDIVKLRKMMMDRGYEVACGICYVESTRREMGRITQEFIDRYKIAQQTGKPIARVNASGQEVVLKSQGKTFMAEKGYTPNLGELNTTEIDFVKRDHPEVYNAYLAFMNARGQAKPKLLETRAEYKGEILKQFKNKNAVDKKNLEGGLRLQSFSDFELPHLIDMMQIVMDMSRVGLKSQAYTKVPKFAEAFGDTGIKINLSLIAKGSGVDENGNLVFDDVEGINHEEAFRIRDKFSNNVGTILVGKSDEHIRAAMADPRIDMIIPFHKSSWKESLYEALGLTGYTDYTKYQMEKPGDKSKGKIEQFHSDEYWDYSKTGDENAQIYLQKCREDGRTPVFPQFQNEPGYWKMLIDFKMYDNDGVGAPHEEVKPIFDDDYNAKILNEYKGGHRKLPVAQDVVDDFVKEYSSEVKFQDRDSDGRELSEAQAEFFKGSQARDKKGRLLTLYHGTRGKFTEFNPAHSDDKISFFFTSNREVAHSYAPFDNTLDPYSFVDENSSLEELAKVIETDRRYVSVKAVDIKEAEKAIAEFKEKGNSIIKAMEHLLEITKGTRMANSFYMHSIRDNYSAFKKWIEEGIVPSYGNPLYTAGSKTNEILGVLKEGWDNPGEEVLNAMQELLDVAKPMQDKYDLAAAYNKEGTLEITDRFGKKSYLDKRQALKEANMTQSGGILPVYVNLVNPLILDAGGKNWNRIPVPPEMKETTDRTELRTRDVSEFAHSHGYDGVIFKNLVDMSQVSNVRARKSTVVVAFDSAQIKSVDNKTPTADPDIRYSLREVDPVQPASDKWQRTSTTSEVMAKFPDLWNVAAEESETRNPTQITGTVRSYRKIYDFLKDEGFDGKILDASSGLGYGTKAGIEEYGFDVEDIEPYPDKSYHPKYKDYSKLNKKYDVIISNAVLNVIPQDQRDALVVKMGELLNDGGRIFINVRGKDVENASSKVAINKDLMEYYISNTGSYQKGFTKDELVAYLQDALGDGFTVEKSNMFGAVSAVVTKDRGTKYSGRDSDEGKYEGKVFYEDSEIYSYDFLTSLHEMTVLDMPPLSVTKVNGQISQEKAAMLGLENAKAIGDKVGEGLYSVKNDYTGRSIRIGKNGLKHGTNGENTSRLRTNARLSAIGGEIVKNAVPINALKNKNRQAKGTYAMACLVKSGDMEVVAVITVEEHSSQVVGIDYVNIVHSINGRIRLNKKDSLSSTREKGYGQESAPNAAIYTLNIADFLEIVNETHKSLLSDDVLKHLNEERPEGGHYTGEVLFQERLSAADQNRVVILEDQIKRLKADIKEIERHYEKAQDYARAEGILIGQVEQGKEMAKTIASRDAELRRKKESYERKAKNYEDMLEAKRAKIKEIRQRRDEILAERKAAFEAYREQRNESIRSGGTRKSIEKNAKTLMDWLLKNSDKEHVPEALKTTVGEFLETIDFTSKRGLAGGEPTKKDQAFAQKLNNLAAMLEKQRSYMNNANEGDAENPLDCFLDLPEGFAEEIRKLADDVAKTAIGGNFVINDMNSEQLAQLNKALRVLKTSISKMNKLITNAHFASVTEAARNSMLEMAEYKAHKPMNDISEQADKMLKWEMFTPVYAFKRYGSAGESIFRGIRNGWSDFAFAIDKVLKFTKGTYTDEEVEAWEKETHSIKLSDGKTVTLTTAQLMSLYCLNKREQARGHIYGGGIRIADIKKGKVKIQQTEPYLVSFEDVETLIAELSDRQIDVADKLQKFMTEQGSEWGNKVSMERFGYRAFTEENYFPIESDANNLIAIDPEAKANDMFRLLNMSATKSLTKGANNAIVISDIFDIFSNHMSDMAKYGSLALPILDTMKWYNYKVRYDVGDGQFRTETVQKSVERAYGKAGKSYFTNFMKDLNGVKEGGRGIGLVNKMVSNYKIASVGANLRVAVLQPTSIVRASMEIEPKYLLQALTKAPAAKKAESKSGVALWKSLGFYNTDIARGIRDQIKGGGKTIDKVRDKTMILAEKMDRITFGTLWNAAEAKAKDLGYSGEELDVKTTEIFDNIIYKTQVVDSTLTRSSLMRSTNEAVKSITAFMAEPTLSYNMVAETLYDMVKERDFSTGWQKNSERFGKAVAIYAASSIAAAVIESIPDAFRDDDDEEWFGQKWWQAFWGERFWDGNLLSEINVLEKIPLLKDFISVRKGYDIQRLDAAWMSSLNKAIDINTELYNVYVKGEKPTKTTYWGKMTAYGAAYANLRAISQIAGLPVSNTVRDVVAIWNTIVGGMAPSLKVKTYDDSKKK